MKYHKFTVVDSNPFHAGEEIVIRATTKRYRIVKNNMTYHRYNFKCGEYIPKKAYLLLVNKPALIHETFKTEDDFILDQI